MLRGRAVFQTASPADGHLSQAVLRLGLEANMWQRNEVRLKPVPKAAVRETAEICSF